MAEAIRNVCPVRRNRCDTAEVCWLIFCATGGAKAQLRPITERELTKAERYNLAMSEQRKAKAR